MDARLLVVPKFMKSERFGLGDVPKEPLVTIERVKTLPQRGDGGEEEVWGLLIFKEPWAKPLKVIPTTLRCLLAMFNPEGDYDTNRWMNKRLSLYAMRGVFFGKPGTAVRIKGSPDISLPISVAVKKFGGGSDVYNLVPTGQSQPPTPYEHMWAAWKAAGRDEKDGRGFKTLIRTALGKNEDKVLDEDVAKFEAALNRPPPEEKTAEPGSAG